MEISPEELSARLKSGVQLELIDCREPDEFQIGAIAGATLIPLASLAREAVARFRGDKSREIVLYCHHGLRSLRGATLLAGMGFDSVRSLRGGIDAWSDKIDAAIPRY